MSQVDEVTFRRCGVEPAQAAGARVVDVRMDPAWDAVVGGLLGAVGGEVWTSLGVPRFDAVGPVGAALVDVCHGYVAHRGAQVPVEAGGRQCGAPGSAWALAVAMARQDIATVADDTLELAVMLGVRRPARAACVSYAELAARLLAGWPTREAVAVAPGDPGSDAPSPTLCGDAVLDSLRAGIWALHQPAGVADVARALEPITTPGVVAEAAGLVGLRDGAGTIPDRWLGFRCAAECWALAPALVRLRRAVAVER